MTDEGDQATLMILSQLLKVRAPARSLQSPRAPCRERVQTLQGLPALMRSLAMAGSATESYAYA